MAVSGASEPPGTVYFEFKPMGQQMRVAAIDAGTGIEVVVVAPVSATRSQMQAVALAKLRRRLGEAGTPEPRRF
jgi:hypothetical protein